MSWVITKDHLDPHPSKHSRVGRGEGWLAENLGLGEPVTSFKLYDDDGELYYSGVMTVARLNGDESQAFAPLDWARYYSGCTELRYRDPITKVWRTL